MTQNLDLDLSAGQVLTSDTTNITSADSWTVPSDFEMWTEEDQRVAQDSNVTLCVHTKLS